MKWGLFLLASSYDVIPKDTAIFFIPSILSLVDGNHV